MDHTVATYRLLKELLVYKRIPLREVNTNKINKSLFNISADYIGLSEKLKWVKYADYIVEQYKLTGQAVFAIELEEKFKDKNVINILKGKEGLEKIKVGNMVAWEPSWEIKSMLLSLKGRESEIAQT